MSISPLSEIPLGAEHINDLIKRKVCPLKVGVFNICEDGINVCKTPLSYSAHWDRVYRKLRHGWFDVRWDEISDYTIRMGLGLVAITPPKDNQLILQSYDQDGQDETFSSFGHNFMIRVFDESVIKVTMLNASAVQKKLSWRQDELIAGLDHMNKISTIEIRIAKFIYSDLDMLSYYGITTECAQAIRQVVKAKSF